MHFMIAEKSSDVKVQRVSRLVESKARCCISRDFGGFYQIIPCIRPVVVRIKVAHDCPATIRIFILGRAVQALPPRGRADAEQYLRPGVDFAQLDAQERALTDLEAARRLNAQRETLFRELRATA